ncbi:hypothetical protein LPY66_14790 [Dehalobacter sp. DCM]|uniref:hypothetical protein n=1 Tax=Dehalobacter sp. DCM TaxID=2907827 RepID=UPI0030812F43|nr:hypothetical protein LPY66_14790 [Dehalobacter sp. DCM]
MLKILIVSFLSAIIGLILGWVGFTLFAPSANMLFFLSMGAVIGFVCSLLSQCYLGSSMKKMMAKAQG